jgi:hypothetical protein
MMQLEPLVLNLENGIWLNAQGDMFDKVVEERICAGIK